MTDPLYTPHDPATDGAATALRFSGFRFEMSGERDAPQPSDPVAAEIVFFGTSDLALEITFDAEEDAQNLSIASGSIFATTIDGVPTRLETLETPQFETLTIEDHDGGVAVMTIGTETEGGFSGYVFYLNGALPFTDGLPTADELQALVDGIEDPDSPTGTSLIPDGVLSLRTLPLAQVETTLDVPEMPAFAETLCEVAAGITAYDTYYDAMAAHPLSPVYLDSFISAPVERDGTVADDAPLDPAYRAVMQDFADAVAAESGLGLRLYDFETEASGNFAGAAAATSYLPSAGQTLANTDGDMADGTAQGTLSPDTAVSWHLFNTGHSVGTPTAGDDPGVATQQGHDADRGFNLSGTADDGYGTQYLEVMPSEDQAGGLIVCFEQQVLGFAFHLMGREETKRDVRLDIHFSDGTVYSSITGTNAVNTGGEQFYGFLLDSAEAEVSIDGFVLYEEYDEDWHSPDLRDIFAIDDLALVTPEGAETITPADYMNATREMDLSGEPGDGGLTPGTDPGRPDIPGIDADDRPVPHPACDPRRDDGPSHDKILPFAGTAYTSTPGPALPQTVEFLTPADFYTRITGTNAAETLNGDMMDNLVQDLAGDDFVFAGGGDDTILDGLGDDEISGGDGLDTLVLPGSVMDTLLRRVDDTTVQTNGATGANTVEDVEFFCFDDMTLSLTDLPLA